MVKIDSFLVVLHLARIDVFYLYIALIFNRINFITL